MELGAFSSLDQPKLGADSEMTPDVAERIVFAMLFAKTLGKLTN